jgi:hypothetical protein
LTLTLTPFDPPPPSHPTISRTADYHSEVVATVLPVQYCGGATHLGYLFGVTTETAKGGVATFDKLSAYCYPGGNMTVQFEVLLSGLDLSYSVAMQRTLVFRDCYDGEVRQRS